MKAWAHVMAAIGAGVLTGLTGKAFVSGHPTVTTIVATVVSVGMGLIPSPLK